MSSKTKVAGASSSKESPTREQDAPTTLVPKLRFPEFREAEGWEASQLIALSSVGLSNGVFNDPKKVGTGYKLINVSDMYIDTTIDEARLSLLKLSPSEFEANQVIHGDIFFTRSSLVKSGIAVSNIYLGSSRDVTFDGHLIRFRANTSKVVPLFAHYLFKTAPIRAQLVARGKSATMTTIGQADVASVVLFNPEKEEQKKIASCLSSVDELIAAQARKLDALKTHKKGLIQQLFPRDGETQPRLRFPDFQDAGKWERVALGDIAEIKLGKMLDTQRHTTGHLLPYLNNLAVRWNEVKTSDLPKMYFSDLELDRFGLRAGDVVVCEGGEPGRAAVWDGRLPDLKFQKAIHRVRFSVPFEPKVLVLHLENLAGTVALEKLFTGGGIKHLTAETFSRLKVPLIPYPEQQRIATFLSNFDDLLTAESQKLETLKAHKRGLMQQLFSSPEEVEA